MVSVLGLNGPGRTGGLVARAISESYPNQFRVGVINHPSKSPLDLFRALRDDPNYGIWEGLGLDGNRLTINGNPVVVTNHRSPEQIPWHNHNVELVVEASGKFTDAEKARGHLAPSVRQVIVTAPSKGADLTVVHGVNSADCAFKPRQIISAASCTTTGAAPVLQVVERNVRILKSNLTTVHALTHSQPDFEDRPGDIYDRAATRAGRLNIVPTDTGAAKALQHVTEKPLTMMAGAYRVPTPTVSVVDMQMHFDRTVTRDEVLGWFREASETYLRGVLEVRDSALLDRPLELREDSIMMMGNPHAATVFEVQVTLGDLVRVSAWYDNEWGYAFRVAQLCDRVAREAV